MKTELVARTRGRRCGDIELAGYLAIVAGPVPLVLDLRIAHDRFGSSSDPSINGHLHYPNDVDRSLNEAAADKSRQYRADYNRGPLTLSPLCLLLLVGLGGYIVNLCAFYFLQAHREKTDRFFAASGVQLAQPNRGQFHYRRGVLLTAQVQGQQHPRQGDSTTDHIEYSWCTYHVEITHSPITFANLLDY